MKCHKAKRWVSTWRAFCVPLILHLQTTKHESWVMNSNLTYSKGLISNRKLHHLNFLKNMWRRGVNFLISFFYLYFHFYWLMNWSVSNTFEWLNVCLWRPTSFPLQWNSVSARIIFIHILSDFEKSTKDGQFSLSSRKMLHLNHACCFLCWDPSLVWMKVSTLNTSRTCWVLEANLQICVRRANMSDALQRTRNL